MKVGILGIAHMHVYSYISELKKNGIPLTGVHDHNQAALQEFCQTQQVPLYTTVSALLQSECDTVLICSENSYHKDLTLQAIAAGKHVIVEKPMALSTADAKTMIAAAKQQSTKLMVAHPVRFSKTAQDFEEVLSTAQLGQLLAINSSNHGKNPGGWFVQPELSGGGALIDHTVHIFDLIHHFFKMEPDTVRAFAGYSTPDLGVEDIGLIQLRFANGVIMSLDTSWNRPNIYPIWGDAVLELIFEQGYLVMDGFGRKAKLYSDANQLIQELYFEEDMDGAMIKAFIHAVEEDLPAPVDGEAGLYTVAITEKAFDSAKQGKELTF